MSKVKLIFNQIILNKRGTIQHYFSPLPAIAAGDCTIAFIGIARFGGAGHRKRTRAL